MKKFFTIKKFFILLVFALFLCNLFGCDSNKGETIQKPHELTAYENHNEKPQSGGTLRLALIDSKNLNPILSVNQNNLYVLKLIFDGLFQKTPNDVVEPVLCDSYTISPDGLSYEFKIKKGVSFHNGSALTAEDVDASLSLLLAAEGVYKNRLSQIESHKANGMTLYVTLKRPVVNFTSMLDFPVLSKKDIGIAAMSYVPNGTGRYKVQSYKKSKELYLSLNQNYHLPFEPYISDILVYLVKDATTAVSMLENLQIDLLPSSVINLNEYTPKRNLSSVSFASGRFTFLGVNNQQPALLSSSTRKALAHALDRALLLNDCMIQYAKPADFPVPPTSFWYNNQSSETVYSTEISQDLLNEAGWRDTDGDGVLEKEVYGETVPLSFEILVNQENAVRMKIATQVQRYLQEVGVVSRVLAVPFEQYKEKIAQGDYDIFVGGVTLSDNYDLSFLLKTEANSCGISNERMDQTFNALCLMEGTAQKQQLFYELCDVFKQEMPIVSLYFEYDALVFDDRLKGAIMPAGSDIFYGIEKWFLLDDQ